MIMHQKSQIMSNFALAVGQSVAHISGRKVRAAQGIMPVNGR